MRSGYPRRRPTSSGPRPLIEGALLAALTVVIALVAYYVPLIGPLLGLTWAIPVMLVHVRHGFRLSVLTVVVAASVLAVIVGPIEALLRAAYFGFVGIAFGYAFRRRLSSSWAILVGSLGSVLSIAAIFTLLFFIFGENQVALMKTAYTQAIVQSQEIWKRFGLEQTPAMQAQLAGFKAFIDNLDLLLPALLVSAGVMLSFLNYAVAGAILPRFGHRVEPIRPFADWRLAPEPLYAAAVVALGAAWVTSRPDLAPPVMTVMKTVGSSLYILIQYTLLIQGLAVAYDFLVHQGMARAMRIVVLVIAFSVPVVEYLGMLVGLLDPVVDIRQYWRRRQT